MVSLRYLLFMQPTEIIFLEVTIKVSFSNVFVSPFLWVLRKMVMGYLKEEVVAQNGRVVGSLDLREISRGFIFPTLPLINHTPIDDFK